jgi:hypothetical protein
VAKDARRVVELRCLVFLSQPVLISRAAPHITSAPGNGGADSRPADHLSPAHIPAVSPAS